MQIISKFNLPINIIEPLKKNVVSRCTFIYSYKIQIKCFKFRLLVYMMLQ